MIAAALQSSAHTLELYPELQEAPATATVEVYSPAGSLLKSDDADVDSVDTTIDTVTSNQVLELDDATGIVPGRRYLLRSASGLAATVLVSSLSGVTVRLAQPPPFDVVAGDELVGLRVSFALTSAETATRGQNYRAEFTVTDDAGDVRRWTVPFDVVRTQVLPPMTAERVKAYVARAYPSMVLEDWQYEEIAAEASQRVFQVVRAGGRYPELVGDPSMFADAGKHALYWQLASDFGLFPESSTTSSITEYMEAQAKAMRAAAYTAVDASWYDANDNRAVDVGETGPFSMRVRR